MTLPGAFNYGNRLQNYAIMKIYSSLGFIPTTLILDNFQVLRKVRRALFKLLGRPVQNNEAEMSIARREAFSRFDRLIKVKKINSYFGRWKNDYTLFSVGSDQVWNPRFTKYRMPWFFLKFAKKNKRVALSPSIGVDRLRKIESIALSFGVRNFRGLSIREKKGAELIYQASGLKATVVCDPTIVLGENQWRSISDNRLTPKNNYVFTYLLGGVGQEAAEVLDCVTCHGSVPVVSLSDRQKPGEPDAGPSEFISLIDHAEHVVTDSFHAAVFASILQTPLTIVHREGGASMFSRLEQLSGMLGIEYKVYGSPRFDLSRAGDYDGVREAIGYERERFMKYLKECLNA